MVRIGCMAVLIIINYVLQSTVFVQFSILGVNPDTAIIFIVSYGILRGDVEGAIFGFFAGLTHDLFGGQFVGLYAMLSMLVGYAAGKPFKDYFKDNYFLPFMVVIAATFSYQILFFFTSFLMRGRLDFWFYFTSIILPKTIYTASLAIPLYSLMFVINSRIEEYEHNRRTLFKE
ncbi:MAG: rod shape-determining protein MreD [Defluviitaleaceae bacterium]|nr:rod shape-determining protein MreD [Defluviitaleaceae bacterium]